MPTIITSHNDRSRQGSALVAAGVLMLLIAILATSLTDSSTANLELQIRRRDDMRLMRSAESAVNLAYRHFQTNWSKLSEDQLEDIGDRYTVDLDSIIPGGMVNGCELDARIEKINGIDANDSAYLLAGTSQPGSPDDPQSYRRHRIQISVVPHPRQMFSHVMFAREGFSFQGAAETDSYDSRAGNYDANNPGSKGDLGSEGTIEVKKTDNVNGAIRDNIETPLPEFNYQERKSAAGSFTELGHAPDYSYQLTGTLKTNDWKTYTNYIAANPSENPATAIDTIVSGGNILDLYESQSPYHASSFAVSDAVIRVHGEVQLFCDGWFAVNDAHTVYNTDSSSYPDGSQLLVYQGDYDNEAAGDSQIAWNGQDALGYLETHSDGTVKALPDSFLFMTEDDSDFHLNGSGDAAMMIYAPNANFQLNGTFNFYGSLVGQRFGSVGNAVVNGTFDFHYDEALADYAPDLTPRLVIAGWRSFQLGYTAE
ncbi:MAG: DUF7305 domain-containing protein [Planctomycetota bacterium]